MVRQHGADGRAQQGGEMARQRRHQQHARLRRRDILLEMQQRAERRRVRRLLPHLDLAVADGDGADAERRPGVGEADARDQFISRGQVADRRIVGEERLVTGGERHASPTPVSAP